MAPGEWLVTCGDGLMECISLIYTFKWLAMKSWLALLDKFGQPGIHGKTDATVGSKEWNEFVAAVQDFSQEWAAVTNRSGEIALVEAKTTTSGNGPFDPMVEKLDRAITQLMRGGDLGTSSGQNRQGASLQEDESEILETDDNKVLEETLALKVTRYAIAWKFGPDAPVLVYIKLRTTPRRDLQNDIAVDEFLLGAGAPLGTNATLERYNRPVPDKGDELLKPPMPPKPAGPKPGENNPSQTTANPEFGKSFANVGGAQRSASPTSDKELLIQAALTEFKGINARLEAISRITDPEVQRSKLASVMADLDALEKQLSSAPEVARAIYRILVQGVGNGIEEAAKAHGGKDTQVKPGLNG
jgi:phage gp29-like protein